MKNNQPLSRTARYMIYAIIGQFFVFLVLGLTIILAIKDFEQPLPFALGLLQGCFFSVVKVVFLERSIARSLEREEQAAKNYAQAQYFLRTLITVGSLMLAVFLPKYFGLFGTILGFLTIQLSAYIANQMLKRSGYPED